MCRWLAYSGSPVLLEDLLFKPENSLVVQSRHSQLGVEPINGDGSGSAGTAPRTPRASTTASSRPGTIATCESSPPSACRSGLRPHPCDDRHGGPADELPSLSARPLALDAQRRHRRLPVGQARPDLAVEPALFPEIEGSTDSELFFYLALTFGLEEDPPRQWPEQSASSRRPGDATALRTRSR